LGLGRQNALDYAQQRAGYGRCDISTPPKQEVSKITTWGMPRNAVSHRPGEPSYAGIFLASVK